VNACLWSANAITHTKIIIVSLAAAILFAAVGITSQISNKIQRASVVSTALLAAQIPKSELDLRHKIARLRLMFV
jgi:hypothetical protein